MAFTLLPLPHTSSARVDGVVVLPLCPAKLTLAHAAGAGRLKHLGMSNGQPRQHKLDIRIVRQHDRVSVLLEPAHLVESRVPLAPVLILGEVPMERIWPEDPSGSWRSSRPARGRSLTKRLISALSISRMRLPAEPSAGDGQRVGISLGRAHGADLTLDVPVHATMTSSQSRCSSPNLASRPMAF